MADIYLADSPTYAAHLAAYPEYGAAILALPAGTRRYIEDMGCEIRRSASGKVWIPDLAPTSPRYTGANAHWIGPANMVGLSNSASQTRKMYRPTYYRMPGFRPATISRISLYQNAAGAFTSGSDSCVLRLYAANPDGSPIVGAAPLFVWNFNAAGSGGAGVLSLVSAGANATRIHADLAGGAKEVPPHFWLAFAHDLDTTAPNLGTTTPSSSLMESGPAELSGSDLANSLNINRSQGYTWTEATAWTIGDMAVWPAAEYVVAGQSCVAPHLKVTG